MTLGEQRLPNAIKSHYGLRCASNQVARGHIAAAAGDGLHASKHGGCMVDWNHRKATHHNFAACLESCGFCASKGCPWLGVQSTILHIPRSSEEAFVILLLTTRKITHPHMWREFPGVLLASCTASTFAAYAVPVARFSKTGALGLQNLPVHRDSACFHSGTRVSMFTAFRHLLV